MIRPSIVDGGESQIVAADQRNDHLPEWPMV